jgi:hypothetical protein
MNEALYGADVRSEKEECYASVTRPSSSSGFRVELDARIKNNTDLFHHFFVTLEAGATGMTIQFKSFLVLDSRSSTHHRY